MLISLLVRSMWIYSPTEMRSTTQRNSIRYLFESIALYRKEIKVSNSSERLLICRNPFKFWQCSISTITDNLSWYSWEKSSHVLFLKDHQTKTDSRREWQVDQISQTKQRALKYSKPMLIFLARYSKVLFQVSDDLENAAELCASLC